MNSSLLFYTVNEKEDVEKYCKRKKLKPFKFETKDIDGCISEQAIQYVKKNYLYEVLECDRCYSGYMITLMRLPQLSYEELLQIAISSKYHDERAGAIGIILKDHSIKFEEYMQTIVEMDVEALKRNKRIKRMVSFIHNFVKENTSHVQELKKILLLCEKVEEIYK